LANHHPTRESYLQFQSACERLYLFQGIISDPVLQAMLWVVRSALAHPEAKDQQVAGYYRAAGMLLSATESASEPIVGNAWQNHLLGLLLQDENPFSLKTGFQPLEDLSAALRQAAAADLQNLQIIFSLDLDQLPSLLLNQEPGNSPLPALPWNWHECQAALPMPTPFQADLRQKMKEQMLQADKWDAQIASLATYYRKAGTGMMGQFKAFRWNPLTGSDPLVGIRQPDPVTLDELIGYDLAREEVLNNTRNLMRGFPANNVLLYGDRGTGKSSTVKAILNAHAESGLRLVEVPRSQLHDFPRIIALLRRYPQRFILFVDDLSFEDNEWNYKELKAVLEGGLEVRPPHVVVYATSNRRHLIREKFSDRGTPRPQANLDEVHESDTTQEKLSLADRFGITVTFTTPDQEKYLEIVSGLARLKGLDIDPAVLRRRALQWERWQNVRSGRTARQFIDYLAAELEIDVN
jgi:uncharacterized protein